MEAKVKQEADARAGTDQTKKRLYALIERIKGDDLHAVERYLEYVAVSGDPVLRALENAPEDDEPLTQEDVEALEEGRRALEAGDVISNEELKQELGI